MPAHTVWLLDDGDVKARAEISRRFLQTVAGSLIGLEALQREESLSKAGLTRQAVKMREIERELGSVGAKVMLSVHAPYMPIGKFDLASGSDAIRRTTIDAFVKCVDLAEDLEAKVVNAHLGGLTSSANEKDFTSPNAKKTMMERLKDALGDLSGRTEGRGVMLAIENLPYPLEELGYGYSPLVGIFAKDFLEILESLDSKDLGVTVDFCHLWIAHKTLRGFLAYAAARESGEGIRATDYHGLTIYETDAIKSLAENAFESFVPPLCEKIIHIHAADSDGIYVPGRSNVSEGKALGEGDLDLEGFVRSLRQIEHCTTRTKVRMIVSESKEADLNYPINSLRNMLRLYNLIKKK